MSQRDTSIANYLNHEIPLRASERFGGRVILWRNNRLEAKAIGRNGKMRHVSAGIDGQADLSGILPDGRRLEVETKTKNDKMQETQKAFRRMIESHNGVYITAWDRSNDPDACVEKCIGAIADHMAHRQSATK